MKIVKQTSSLMIIKDRNIMSFLFALVFASIGFLIILSPDFLNADPPKLLGVPFLLIGLLLMFNIRMYTIIINKGINELSIIWRKLIGYGKDEYDLNEINQLDLRTSDDSKRLVFILKDGEEIILPLGDIKGVMGTKLSSIKSIGENIANFLDIKFIKIRSKSLVESLYTVQEIIREKRSQNDKREDTYKN